MHVLEAETADVAWRKAVDLFRDNDPVRIQPSRAGQTRELLHVALVIHNPIDRWVLSRRPAISVPFAIIEALGILGGRRDALFFNYWNPQLPKYAGCVDDYQGAYGFRLHQSCGFDQIERAYLALKENPDSRQVVLQIWDPALDLPSPDGHPASEDVPCNVCSILKVRDGKLEWTQVLRSNDLFLGVPYNFVQFTTLQEVIAGWLGIQVGSYTHVADSLHIYDRDLERVLGYQATKLIPNTDSLFLSKELFDSVLHGAVRAIDDLARPTLTQDEILSIANRRFPTSYKNLLLVVAADSARRHGWPELMSVVMDDCESQVLKELWNNWMTRKSQTSTQAG